MIEHTADASPNILNLRASTAAREIADFERSWSVTRARDTALSPELLHGLTPDLRLARVALQAAFYQLIEAESVTTADAEAIMDLFIQTPEVPNATLARIDMNGEWDSAEAFQRRLFPIMTRLRARGYDDIRWLQRRDLHERPGVTIPAGLTDQHGYVALRRKRPLIVATGLDLPPLTLDKVSMFALDINKLNALSIEAADEVRLIVAATMFKACDSDMLSYVLLGPPQSGGGDPIEDILASAKLIVGDEARQREILSFERAVQDAQRLVSVMKRYNISTEELEARVRSDHPIRLAHPDGLSLIEDAIEVRSGLLMPAMTTYYVRS